LIRHTDLVGIRTSGNYLDDQPTADVHSCIVY